MNARVEMNAKQIKKGGILSRSAVVGVVMMTVCIASLCEKAAGVQDPCADFGSVAKGSAFNVGIAFLPNSDVTSWKSPSGQLYHPCRNKANLPGAFFSVFAIETDTISVLKIPRLAQEAAFASAIAAIGRRTLLNVTSTTPSPGSSDPGSVYGLPPPTPSNSTAGVVPPTPVGFTPPAAFLPVSGSMTAVAFLGTQIPVMSDPFVVRSTNPLLGMGRVPKLTLIVRLSKGKTVSMRWDIRAGACGACKSGNCINGLVCATPEESCLCATNCAGALCANCPVTIEQCSLSIHVAFVGDDKHQSPLVTGLELERVRAYSMSAGIADRISAIGDQRDSLTGQLNNYG